MQLKEGECVTRVLVLIQYGGSQNSVVCLDGMRRNGFEAGIDKWLANTTRTEHGSSCVLAQPNDHLIGTIILPYIPKDQFDLRNYQITFNDREVRIKVDDNWACDEHVDDADWVRVIRGRL